MDESGGSGQPRSGTDESTERESTERRTDRTAPAADPARPDPTPSAEQPPAAPPLGTDRDDNDTAHEAAQPPHHTEAHPQDDPERDTDGHDANADGEHPQQAQGARAPDNDPAAEPSEPHAQQPPTTPYPDHTTAPDTHDRTLAHSGTTKNQPPQRPQEPRGGLLMGRPFGVPVYVAPSWFLVAALITWVFGGQLDRVLPELGAARYLVSLFFAVAFYASVLVHELAHTVAALRFKLPVRRIQLQFFGGVSEIEKEAETPGREFVLAFVGPLLSLVLAGVFYAAMQPVEPGTVPGVLLAGLMISNLIVAAFNLLPGLPLDGGRMLRAVV
ncbi:site-2 protease family protein, partial [Streptomyces sp. NPDC006356]